MDGEPWRAVSLYHPDGRKLVEITAKGPQRNYGLTELFSESSEPSFDVFPIEKFKQLFPVILHEPARHGWCRPFQPSLSAWNTRVV